MFRRLFIKRVVQVIGGLFAIGVVPQIPLLRKVNTTLFSPSPAAADCVTDNCTTSDSCTNDECTIDQSEGVCNTDRCHADYSKGCTTDECATDKSGECEVDYCGTDLSGTCTNDNCSQDKSGNCEGDCCNNDISTACKTDDCVCDFSKDCTEDACGSDASDNCNRDKCDSDKSGECSGDGGYDGSCYSDGEGAYDNDYQDAVEDDEDIIGYYEDDFDTGIRGNSQKDNFAFNSSKKLISPGLKGLTNALKWLYRV